MPDGAWSTSIECSPCRNAAIIAVAYRICLQNAYDKKACRVIKEKVMRGEIDSVEKMVEEFKKATHPRAHELLEEVLDFASQD
ncbi:MAG: hypothetical protein QXI60_07465 [Thermofilaceae archaeon]